MAKVVQLGGQRPAGWAQDRWSWQRAVWADARLTPMARLVATVLAAGYANHETAECTPGVGALMKAVSASRSTVLRALADLQAAGWLERHGGNAPGRSASYAFCRPGEAPAATPVRPLSSAARGREQVSSVTPVQVSSVTPVQVSSVTPDDAEQVSSLTRTGVIPASPPTPPYKDKPNLNHRTRTPRQILRGLPRPSPLSAMVPEGSDQEAAWNEWLQQQGHPPLAIIGRKIGVGMITGWDLPWRWPPSPDDPVATGLGLRFADWMRSIA